MGDTSRYTLRVEGVDLSSVATCIAQNKPASKWKAYNQHFQNWMEVDLAVKLSPRVLMAK